MAVVEKEEDSNDVEVSDGEAEDSVEMEKEKQDAESWLNEVNIRLKNKTDTRAKNHDAPSNYCLVFDKFFSIF